MRPLPAAAWNHRPATAWLLVLGLVAGCAGPQGPARHRAGTETTAPPPPAAALAPGSLPVALEFLYVFENVRQAPYFPIEGIGGVAYGLDGSLLFCDEKGGRVHGLDPATDQWFMFDDAPSRPYRPIDVRVDGFSVLVLDLGARLLLRFESSGAYQDRLLSFSHLDPVAEFLPTAFDVDRDGRVVATDAGEQQVLLLDSFLTLTQTVGEPGPHREQFDDPSGVVFLPDGGFVVADRGNRRLQRFNRLGFYESMAGGEFDLHNPLVTPQGVDCDQHGNVFVADPANSAVHVFSRSLRFLFSVGSELGLVAAPEMPLDVAVGPQERLAVSDRGRQAVLVYKIVYE